MIGRGFSKRKLGEVSWATISIILLVVSIAVLVLIFIQLNSSVSSEREACATSALLRGTVPEVGGLTPKDYIDLNCKTRKVCISYSSKGNCSDFKGSKFETVKISGIDRTAKENQIRQALAREMADCWNMMGEGNLEVFSREFTSSSYSAATVICSRIAFDSNIVGPTDLTGPSDPKYIPSISGMNNYLLTHKVPGKNISYWDYFRGTPDGDTLSRIAGPNIIQTNSDVMDLRKETAVIYIEFNGNSAGLKIGQLIGGGLALLASAKGKAKVPSTLGGSLFFASILAGGNLGDSFYNNYVGSLDGLKSISGLFFVDYSQEGFEKLSFNKDEMYIASKA
jgi:hypothetical protein